MWSPTIRSDELYHWVPFGRKKEDSLQHAGSVVSNKQPDKFKYMAKVEEGTNTRYFYSQAELDAYKNSLSKEQLAKTNIQMMSEKQADMELIDKDALQKSIDKEKADKAEEARLAAEREAKKKAAEEAAKKAAEETDKDKKKSGSGGSGKGKGGKGKSGKGKGKGKGKEKDSKEKTPKLDISEMSDKELLNYLDKHKDMADKILKDLGLSTKMDLKDLKKKMEKEAFSVDTETLYEAFDRLGYVKNKKKNKSLKHSEEEFLAMPTYSEELYHYGRQGMKWYQHIYGPVQSIAKYAQKAGSKISNAKASHDAKAEAKWEKKKEKIIRSGDAKKVQKYFSKLTDDELKRADNRINEENALNSMTGKHKQQAQTYVQNQGKQNNN